MQTLDCDYLVIGSGLAGLSAALELAEHGSVIVSTKKQEELSSSAWAQGGVSCVVDPADSFKGHVADTLDAGAGMCDREVVQEVVEAAPQRVQELETFGVHFETRADGSYDLGTEGGHTHRRVMHAGDITGEEIIRVMLEKVHAHPNITVMEKCFAIDLVTTGWLKLPGPTRCVGGYFLNVDKESVFAVRAPYTMLATGGAGKVYLYTSNPDVATGDGIAMAWRAGLPIRNMEFVQFHPTCLYHPDARSFLISEAVRGEGAELINAAGEAFMVDHDPRGALAPRDIVARAIDFEIKRRGDPCVFLDIRHKSRAELCRRFPNIYATCESYGFCMDKDLIPVVPAAHYCCGGVIADVDGVTHLPGLYASGEVTCTGMHGANRLASNSLLEARVCAVNAASHMVQHGDAPTAHGVEIPDWEYGDAVSSDEAIVVEHNWNEVRTCMWDYVGIVRSNRRLERAFRRIRNLRREIQQYYTDYLVNADMLELRNIADVAELIVRSAFLRRESRGLHFNLDYPEPDTSQPSRDTVIEDPPGGALFL